MAIFIITIPIALHYNDVFIYLFEQAVVSLKSENVSIHSVHTTYISKEYS